MTTESLEIRVHESGAPIVRQKIDAIGDAANDAEVKAGRLSDRVGRLGNGTIEMGRNAKIGFLNFTKGQQEAAEAQSKFFGDMQGLFALAAVGLGAGWITGKFISSTREAQEATAQLQATLTSMGNTTGFTLEELEGMAGGLQKITAFGDDAIVKMQSVLATFSNVQGEQFAEATRLVLDLSAKFGGDLEGRAIQIGKALQDPVQGINALSRAGVSFTQTQKEMIESLVASGRGIEAQKMVMAELENQVGGSAVAMRGTLGGALTALGEAFGDLFEQGSEETSGFQGSVEELIGVLQSPETIESFHAIGRAIFSITGAMITATEKTVGFAEWLGRAAAITFSDDGIVDQISAEDRVNELLEEQAELRASLKGSLGGVNREHTLAEIRQNEVLLKQANDKLALFEEEAQSSATTAAKKAEHRAKDFGDESKAAAKRREEQEKEADRLNKMFQDEVAENQKAIALLGAKTEVEKALFETQKGRFEALSVAQKARLVDLSRELQAKKDLQQLADDERAGAEEDRQMQAENEARDLQDQADFAKRMKDQAIELQRQSDEEVEAARMRRADPLTRADLEIAQINEAEEKKRQAILMNTELTETQRAQLLSNLAETTLASEEEIERKRAEMKLNFASSFFGNLATLTRTGNKKLQAIGKAAALAQATVDGALAVQKALSSAPPPINFALAAAAAAAAGVQIATISKSTPGFSDGGFTGSIGRADVAGLVHGQEFVVNAPATAAPGNRAILERMNAGKDISGETAGVTVNIQNFGTSKAFEVEQVSEREIRIIARDEADAAVRRGTPSLVSAEIANPNSQISKSLERNTEVTRRR